jgi:tRNA1Val (adenine37-N6)-methyltransferase
MAFAPEALTTDAFLGGRLAVRQPRWAIAPVWTRCFWPPPCRHRRGSRCWNLGSARGLRRSASGGGCQVWRLPGLEVQADYAALARENAAANGIALEVMEGDWRGFRTR